MGRGVKRDSGAEGATVATPGGAGVVGTGVPSGFGTTDGGSVDSEVGTPGTTPAVGKPPVVGVARRGLVGAGVPPACGEEGNGVCAAVVGAGVTPVLLDVGTSGTLAWLGAAVITSWLDGD